MAGANSLIEFAIVTQWHCGAWAIIVVVRIMKMYGRIFFIG
jgi:hypothetical protein